MMQMWKSISPKLTTRTTGEIPETYVDIALLEHIEKSLKIVKYYFM